LEVGAVYPVRILEKKDHGLLTLLVQGKEVEAAACLPLNAGMSFWMRVDAIHPRVVLKILSVRRWGSVVM